MFFEKESLGTTMRRCHTIVTVQILTYFVRATVTEITNVGLWLVQNGVVHVDCLDVAPSVKYIHGGL